MRRPTSRQLCAVFVLTTGLIAAQAAAVQPALAAETVPVYAVTQEGLTRAEAQQLADAFGIPNRRQDDGSFDHTGDGFQDVPSTAGATGVDEDGQRTVDDVVDLAAVDKIQPMSDRDALARGAQLVRLAGLTEDLTATPEISHSDLSITDRSGRALLDQPLDTTVIYRLGLRGLPVTGAGARLRVTFGPDGTTTQLSHALRKLMRAGDVSVISVDAATKACAALSAPDVRQERPTLGYEFPTLTGDGSVRTIFPQYTCHSVGPDGRIADRLVPAVPDSGPSATFTASVRDEWVTATAKPSGGTAPYTFRWSSSSTTLSEGESGAADLTFQRRPRGTDPTERLVLQITDANGLTATGTVDIGGPDTKEGVTVPGGGSFGTFATGGIEIPVNDGSGCEAASVASANGFSSALTSHGASIKFDFRGNTAWESDFKDPSRPGGNDSAYVDKVDIAWYSGHGNPNGFTFNTNQTDKKITPADALWGPNLEWLNLQSCNVLQDVNGTKDYITRWGPTFKGLHMINGFHTGAGCVTPGLGGAFASRLFPGSHGSAMKVRKAWAAAIIARDPGKTYRTVGAAKYASGPGFIDSTMNDYFWGQGSTSPDILPDLFWQVTGNS